MHRRISVASLFATAAILATGLPAAANAATPVSAQNQVGAHLKSAQSAAKKVTRLVRKGDAAGASKALKTARREAVAAARGARILAAGAQDSSASAQQAIYALTAAAGTYGDAMQRFSSLIPSAGDQQLQQTLATALPGTIAGRQQLIDELTQLVNELTGSAQTLAAQALAALQAAAPAQVQQMATVAGLGDLPTQISTIIQQALATATTALQTGLSSLTALVPDLPAGADTQVTTALSSITATVQQLLPMLQQILGTATTAATTGIQAATGILQQLLGGVLGGFLGGTTPGAGIVTGTTTPAAGSTGLGGLLGGLLKLPTGLPSGILGGLSGLLGGGLLGGH